MFKYLNLTNLWPYRRNTGKVTHRLSPTQEILAAEPLLESFINQPQLTICITAILYFSSTNLERSLLEKKSYKQEIDLLHPLFKQEREE